jgi:hypothetical protein
MFPTDFEFLFRPIEELDAWFTGLFAGAPLLVALGIAFVLGLRHASDPDHLVALHPHSRHQSLAELGRGLELLDRTRQHVHGRLQPSQLDATGLALGEMALQLGSLGFLQGTERVRRQVVAVALVAGGWCGIVAHR